MSIDYSTFDSAFDRLWPVALRVARRYTGNAESAKDVAASALERVCADWDRLGGQPWLEAWVVRVTIRAAIGTMRRKPLLFAARHAPDQEARAADGVDLAAALRTLPRRQREAVVLCHYEGFTTQQAAAALGVSPNTVKTHAQRGLASLRIQLGETEGTTRIWTRTPT